MPRLIADEPFSLGAHVSNVCGQANRLDRLVVVAVNSCGPSQIAGLRVGDTILGINGKQCATLEEMELLLRASARQSSISMSLRR